MQLVSSATTTGPNDAFNFLSNGAGQYVFEVFLKLYIGLIFIVTICSLGNRPQGSKWFYTIAFVGFAVITVYMTVSLPKLICRSLAVAALHIYSPIPAKLAF